MYVTHTFYPTSSPTTADPCIFGVRLSCVNPCAHGATNCNSTINCSVCASVCVLRTARRIVHSRYRAPLCLRVLVTVTAPQPVLEVTVAVTLVVLMHVSRLCPVHRDPLWLLSESKGGLPLNRVGSTAKLCASIFPGAAHVDVQFSAELDVQCDRLNHPWRWHLSTPKCHVWEGFLL